MLSIQDHTGKLVNIANPPSRIISLVPSLTELLYDFGLDESVIGITKFCVHPANWFNSKTRVGGTKNINIELIRSLQPDLVIANKEENVKEQIEAVEDFCPVYTTDVKNIDNAITTIRNLGIVTHVEEKANQIADTIQELFKKSRIDYNIDALYLIWKTPYMTVGGDTFINDMMNYVGLRNIMEDQQRYPELTKEAIQLFNPSVILLSSEPYPFKETHKAELQRICPKAEIILVDGEMFSWYGSRMLSSSRYFEILKRQIAHEKTSI